MPWRIPALLERSTDEHFSTQQENLDLREPLLSLYNNSVLIYTSRCDIRVRPKLTKNGHGFTVRVGPSLVYISSHINIENNIKSISWYFRETKALGKERQSWHLKFRNYSPEEERNWSKPVIASLWVSMSPRLRYHRATCPSAGIKMDLGKEGLLQARRHGLLGKWRRVLWRS